MIDYVLKMVDFGRADKADVADWVCRGTARPAVVYCPVKCDVITFSRRTTTSKSRLLLLKLWFHSVSGAHDSDLLDL